MTPNSPPPSPTTPASWPLTLYYDGQCPLCLREIQMFSKRNQSARLHLADISSTDTQPLPGLTREQMLDCLHARFNDGYIVSGIDATYWSYSAVGLGWLVRPLTWRWARPFWQWGYRQFCRVRPLLSKIVPMPTDRQCSSGQCRQKQNKY